MVIVITKSEIAKLIAGIVVTMLILYLTSIAIGIIAPDYTIAVMAMVFFILVILFIVTYRRE